MRRAENDKGYEDQSQRRRIIALEASVAALTAALADLKNSANWEDFVHDQTLYVSKRIGNNQTNVNLGTVQPPANRSYFIPEVVPARSSGMLLNLEVDVSTIGLGGWITLAVYGDTGIVYPDANRWTSGKIFPSALGYTGGAPLLQCTPGELIWYAFNYNATDHFVRAVTSNSQTHILGKDVSGTGSQGALFVTEAALSDPVTQPPTGTIVGNIPAIHATWS